ncbi:MAG: D-alanyl-D-alanine carboxypeptidase/D-alanyl-D-alanine-endopeptidase [Bacteroidota bacterium]|nr:D-alanyl-D-alanine carboxypeptidase/D-alanyl-D-alanine-endopeptidase [Bacteroidota bacterium]
MKKTFCLLLLIVFTIKPQNDSLKTGLNNLLAQPFFDTTIVSVSAYNLNSGTDIFRKNVNMLLRPASNMKVITSAAGLVFLGPDYKFTTGLYYTGVIEKSVLKGDLYVKGGLNPDFTLKDLDSLVAFLTQSGIKRITGKIYGDISAKDSVFWGKGWMWDDDPSTDAPYLAALNINDNAVSVKVSPSKLNEKPHIKLSPESKYFVVENFAKTNSGSNESLEITRDWVNRNNKIIIRGSIGLNSKPVSDIINVYNPAEYFLTLFKEKISEANIKFENNKNLFEKIPENAKVFNKLNLPYGTVIVNLNKTSDNLSAEMTLLALANKYYGDGASATKGHKLVDSLIVLAGMNPKNYCIVDGSGVSHYNLVTSDLLLNVLKFIYLKKPELYFVLYNSFPVGGVDGTLKTRMKDELVLNNVHAKTGTLSGVSTLSGYLKTLKGEDIAFSIMMQNYNGSASRSKYFQDEICKLLVKYGSK